jgi:hypothetical protein
MEAAGVEQPEAPVIVKAGLPHSPCPRKPHGGERTADGVLLRPGETGSSVDPLDEVFIGPCAIGLGLDQGGDRPLNLAVVLHCQRLCRNRSFAGSLTAAFFAARIARDSNGLAPASRRQSPVFMRETAASLTPGTGGQPAGSPERRACLRRGAPLWPGRRRRRKGLAFVDSVTDAQSPMGWAPASSRQGWLAAIQQPPRLQLAERIAALPLLELGQIDAAALAAQMFRAWNICPVRKRFPARLRLQAPGGGGFHEIGAGGQRASWAWRRRPRSGCGKGAVGQARSLPPQSDRPDPIGSG